MRLIRTYIEKEKEKFKKGREKGKNLVKVKPKEAELCVESSEPSSIPWVRLKAIIRCITKAIGSSSKDFIYDEGLLPFGFELVFFLFREAQNKFSYIVCLCPHFFALVDV